MDIVLLSLRAGVGMLIIYYTRFGFRKLSFPLQKCKILSTQMSLGPLSIALWELGSGN